MTEETDPLCRPARTDDFNEIQKIACSLQRPSDADSYSLIQRQLANVTLSNIAPQLYYVNCTMIVPVLISPEVERVVVWMMSRR